MQAWGGGTGVASLILNLGARWRRVVSAMIRPFYPLGSALLPKV